MTHFEIKDLRSNKHMLNNMKIQIRGICYKCNLLQPHTSDHPDNISSALLLICSVKTDPKLILMKNSTLLKKFGTPPTTQVIML